MPSKVWDKNTYQNTCQNITKRQLCSRWRSGMDKSFHLTFDNRGNYLSMPGLKLIHVSKRDPRDYCVTVSCPFLFKRTESPVQSEVQRGVMITRSIFFKKKILTIDTPQHGRDTECLCQYEPWFIFCLSHCISVYNIMLYWTAALDCTSYRRVQVNKNHTWYTNNKLAISSDMFYSGEWGMPVYCSTGVLWKCHFSTFSIQ